MKSVKFISTTLVILFLLSTFAVQAQNRRDHTKEKVTVVKQHGHVRKIHVYHPFWGPRVCFKHRWVYFPKYNFYWDNFRNVFVIRTGVTWVITKNAPQEVEKVDLSKEKGVELEEKYDEVDKIQDNNEEHQSKYKTQ